MGPTGGWRLSRKYPEALRRMAIREGSKTRLATRSWAICSFRSALKTGSARWGGANLSKRVAPAHYMASWIDLPVSVTHLRYVPEMIVAMLAEQTGEFVGQHPEG